LRAGPPVAIITPVNMTDLELAFRFAAAAGLGILMGLEREWTHLGDKTFAGVRTFALLAIAGAAAGYLDLHGILPWIAQLIFLAIAGLVAIEYRLTAAEGRIGITTEVTALLAFVVGLLCLRGPVLVAAALAVVCTLLLALKDWLHGLARKIETADVSATLKFAIISLIVLPLVPDQNFGPPGLEVINPFNIWLMVVLISGLNFASYILVKLVGKEHGLGLTGILGGLVSRTAVTLGFSQRSKKQPEQAAPLALGILLAWTVMFFRIVIMPGNVNFQVGQKLFSVMGMLGLLNLVRCCFIWRSNQARETATVHEGANPFELGHAIQFGLLYGAITFGAKAAQVYLGGPGLYLAGALAGLTDVDAISLSMANLALADPASLDLATRTIAIAGLSNTLVKGAIAVVTGSTSLRRWLFPCTLGILAAGTLLTFLVL